MMFGNVSHLQQHLNYIVAYTHMENIQNRRSAASQRHTLSHNISLVSVYFNIWLHVFLYWICMVHLQMDVKQLATDIIRCISSTDLLGGLISVPCYLFFLEYSGVQHMYCLVLLLCFFSSMWQVYLHCLFLIAPSVFSNDY